MTQTSSQQSPFLKNLDLSKLNIKNSESLSRAQSPQNGAIDTSFPVQVHRMLSQVEAYGLDDIVSWNHNHPDGTATTTFRIHNTHKFEQLVLPRFFTKQSRYRSFQRQLNFYAFQRINNGPLEGSYGHACMQPGNEALARNIKRIPKGISSLQGRAKKRSVSSGSVGSSSGVAAAITITVPPRFETSVSAPMDRRPTVTPESSLKNVLDYEDLPDLDTVEPLSFPNRAVSMPATLKELEDDFLEQQANDARMRRRSTFIMMDKLDFSAENFFAVESMEEV